MLINYFLNTLSVFITIYILPKTEITSNFWQTLFIVSLLIALINVTIKPVVVFISMPINIITLGLFYLVINGFMIWIVDKLVDSFELYSFWYAILFAAVLSIVNWGLHMLKKEN